MRNVLLKNRCSSFRYLVEPVNKKKSSAHAQRIEKWLHFHNETKPNLIKFPFKRKACQGYRVGYGRGKGRVGVEVG